jgi:hypothetical protein
MTRIKISELATAAAGHPRVEYLHILMQKNKRQASWGTTHTSNTYTRLLHFLIVGAKAITSHTVIIPDVTRELQRIATVLPRSKVSWRMEKSYRV